MKILNRINKQERGQILVMTLIVLALSSLVITPLLQFMGTGLNTVRVFRENAEQIYAADAGLQYAVWKIKYDTQITGDRADGTYESYSYDSGNNSALQDLNRNDVNVQIQTSWLFSYLFRIVPGETPHQGSLITTYTAAGDTFTINFYNPSQNPIVVDKMGVWLPPNFEYVNDSCIQSIFPNNMSFANPAQSTVLGGTNLIWDLNYSLGKGSNAQQQFKYSPEGVTPVASTWVYPQQQSVGASWNDSVWWYNVTSTATDNDNATTTVNAVVVFNQDTSDISVVTYTIN